MTPPTLFMTLVFVVLIAPMTYGYGQAKPWHEQFIYTAIDGDTIERIDMYNGGRRRLVRVVGLDSPELGGKAKCEKERILAYKSRARLQYLLATYKIKLVPLKKRDKYSRLLAKIYVKHELWGNRDVANILIKEGLARPYNGEKRESWCE